VRESPLGVLILFIEAFQGLDKLIHVRWELFVYLYWVNNGFERVNVLNSIIGESLGRMHHWRTDLSFQVIFFNIWSSHGWVSLFQDLIPTSILNVFYLDTVVGRELAFICVIFGQIHLRSF